MDLLRVDIYTIYLLTQVLIAVEFNVTLNPPLPLIAVRS